MIWTMTMKMGATLNQESDYDDHLHLQWKIGQQYLYWILRTSCWVIGIHTVLLMTNACMLYHLLYCMSLDYWSHLWVQGYFYTAAGIGQKGCQQWIFMLEFASSVNPFKLYMLIISFELHLLVLTTFAYLSHTQACRHTHTRTHACTHARTHTRMHTHACTHTHTCMHARTHTHTHTHIEVK